MILAALGVVVRSDRMRRTGSEAAVTSQHLVHVVCNSSQPDFYDNTPADYTSDGYHTASADPKSQHRKTDRTHRPLKVKTQFVNPGKSHSSAATLRG